jgi:predicted exporter
LGLFCIKDFIAWDTPHHPDKICNFFLCTLVPQERRLDAAIEELLKLENQMRCAADVSRTRRIVVAIIQLCYEARAWKTLNDQIHLLSQRQQQLQQVL